MAGTAFVFPGQNSHFVGMGRDLVEAAGAAARVLARADEVLGIPLTALMLDGPEAELTATHNQQPAIFAHSAACLALLKERGLQPQVLAGHSLGEYSAVAGAGCLGLEDALRLVRRRGELMARTSGGAMAAVLGLEAAEVEAACLGAREVGWVGIANYNCPGQVVVTGEPDAVAKATELLQAAGAKRVVPLRVSGAFHSPLMQGASDELRPLLDAAVFGEAAVPLVSNVDARPRTSGAEIRAALARQMTGAVQWEASIRRMAADGVDRFVEVGPGKVLAGLIRRIAKDARVDSAGTVDEIAALT